MTTLHISLQSSQYVHKLNISKEKPENFDSVFIRGGTTTIKFLPGGPTKMKMAKVMNKNHYLRRGI